MDPRAGGGGAIAVKGGPRYMSAREQNKKGKKRKKPTPWALTTPVCSLHARGGRGVALADHPFLYSFLGRGGRKEKTDLYTSPLNEKEDRSFYFWEREGGKNADRVGHPWMTTNHEEQKGRLYYFAGLRGGKERIPGERSFGRVPGIAERRDQRCSPGEDAQAICLESLRRATVQIAGARAVSCITSLGGGGKKNGCGGRPDADIFLARDVSWIVEGGEKEIAAGYWDGEDGSATCFFPQEGEEGGKETDWVFQ